MRWWEGWLSLSDGSSIFDGRCTSIYDESQKIIRCKFEEGRKEMLLCSCSCSVQLLCNSREGNTVVKTVQNLNFLSPLLQPLLIPNISKRHARGFPETSSHSSQETVPGSKAGICLQIVSLINARMESKNVRVQQKHTKTFQQDEVAIATIRHNI